MLDIPAQLRNDYVRLLAQRSIPPYSHNHYLKWLRFYIFAANIIMIPKFRDDIVLCPSLSEN